MIKVSALLFIYCIVGFCGTNSCPGFNAGDLLQSGNLLFYRRQKRNNEREDWWES
jgi:hypothetical protein